MFEFLSCNSPIENSVHSNNSLYTHTTKQYSLNINSECSEMYKNLNMSHERHNISQNQCQDAQLHMHSETQFFLLCKKTATWLHIIFLQKFNTNGT
jgi:hypothetical protein